jgi:hypothetical protein
MKNSFKKTLTVYKYLSVLFTIGFWIYIIIDDYHFIEKYWDTHWQDYLMIWTAYFLGYFIGLSIYFWAISATAILLYHKWIKQMKRKNCPIQAFAKNQS